MRKDARCPKCDGRKLFVCESRQPSWDDSNRMFPLTITTSAVSARDAGTSHGTAHRTHVGSWEAWICAACGYAEWYAQDPEGLLESYPGWPRAACAS